MPQHNGLPSSFDVFLIGDTGSITRNRADPVFTALMAQADNRESAIIFLGDNVYPRGLPPENHLLRKDAEGILNAHHQYLKDYPGSLVFMSGNHDWNKGRQDGYEYIIRQEEYLKQLFGKNDIFLPSGGCPGPEEVSLGEHLTAILINTQWWMQKGFRPIGKDCGCAIGAEEEFFEQLVQMINRNKSKRILVAGHAPVYSYAIHGGYYKLKHHLFPFTLYDKKAYIPLPGVGSLLPLYRKYFGAKEDMAHPRYRKFRKRLKSIFEHYPGIIYVSGHEHNLQHIYKNQNHFIISGAGSKLKYVIEDGKYLQFGMKAKGFFKLSMTSEGSGYLSAWVTDRNSPAGSQVYESQIF